MELYLVQHGEAKPESEDPQRPLTDRGRAEVESVAEHVAGLGTEVAQVLHSGRLRATQTAELFARCLGVPQGARELQGLGPLDDPQRAMDLVSQAEEPLMIVGHLPHLGRLASLLVLGDPEKRMVEFRMGGVLCLRKDDRGWVVGWLLVPQLVGKSGQS